MNNPEVFSGAAFFGLALISGSKLVFALAVVRLLSQWWFLSKVEKYDPFVLPCSIRSLTALAARTCGSSTAIPFAATQAS